MQKQGLLSVTFADDWYLQGAMKEQCNQNVNTTINWLTSSGFTIHTKNSVLEPVQSIEFLGFLIGSTTMWVKINTDKSKIVLIKIETFLTNPQPKTRDLASVIGSLVSLFPTMPFGKLCYRNLEKENILALKTKKRN